MSKKNKAPKEYVFRFQGSKEDFLNLLDQKTQAHYSDDYIVNTVGDEIHLGVARGHSGGYWFVSKFNEIDGEIEFRGTLKYGSPINKQKKSDAFVTICTIIGFLISLPILLILCICLGIDWCVRKIFKLPTKNNTIESKLINLMENHLNCKQIK